MSLIEQAAKRLEELRRAGIEQGEPTPVGHVSRHIAPVAIDPSTIEASVRILAEARKAETAATPVAPKHSAPDELPPPTEIAPEPRRSIGARRVELDLAGLYARGFITPDSPRSQLSDEMRVIKRPIMSNAMGKGAARVRFGNLVMVTSALPGEGKTFTSINLALSLATELDTTVLLVDGDVAHPMFPKILGVPQAPGLLDVLTDDGIDVGDALLRTNIENLSVLPSGSHHRRATELLASEQMAALVHDLSSRYSDRIIVFDSPPLLATTEARVLATHMGQVVMVVAADNTLQSDVTLALSTIESCEIVMMVLNKAVKTEIGSYYGYYADESA